MDTGQVQLADLAAQLGEQQAFVRAALHRNDDGWALRTCEAVVGTEPPGWRLAWRDVNLDAATAAVCYELSGSGEHAKRHQLKTEASEATVPLPPFVVERLRAHLDRQQDERPDAANEDGLVFVTPRGYAVNGSWLTKHFQALLARAGLQRLRLHDLRHGAASLLVVPASTRGSPRSYSATHRARRRWRSTATSAPPSSVRPSTSSSGP